VDEDQRWSAPDEAGIAIGMVVLPGRFGGDGSPNSVETVRRSPRRTPSIPCNSMSPGGLIEVEAEAGVITRQASLRP
jgi:hypothetical protein